MNSRSFAWWPLLLSGALIVGCGNSVISATAFDGAIDVPAEPAPIDGPDDVAADARLDARGDAGDDAVNPPDGFVDDVGDDAGDDVVFDDVTKDGPPPDDVVPPDDIPSVDAPAVDVPPVDAPSTGCALPTQRALALTDHIVATTSGMGRINMSTCAGVGGPEHIYPLHVATRTGVALSTEGSMYDTVLMIRRVCDDMGAMSEIACDDDVPGSTTSYLRRLLDPGDYFVIVDQYGGTDGRGGMYTLSVSSFTPAANADCTSAAALAPGTPAMGNTTTGGASSTACINDQWGPQLFYSLTVPPGQRATVTATPTGTPAWRAVVRAQSTCMSGACIANGASAMPGAAASEVIDNRSATPITVVVTVASSTPTAGGAFTLSVALSTPPMAPANATCATPRVVADGATITGDNPGLGVVRLNSVCVGAAQGTALYYRATVPAHYSLVFNATPMGMWDPVLRFLSTCTATSCLASIDAGGDGAPETLRWTNASATPQDVLVAVTSFDASTSGPFNGTVSILPPPGNTTCARATAVTSGMTLMAQNAASGTENLTGPCLPGATGTVLYYSVRVPAGNLATIRARPPAGVDPVIRLLDACGATTCLASANGGAVGATETLSYTNATTMDRTLIVAVGGATNATTGFFDLDVSVRREYTETSIPRACDDMTGAAVLAGVNGDDTVSALTDLPFPFTFYGERELEFSVSSNGLIQLWPTVTGTASNSYDNQSIPTAAAPNGFVAAFWDDMLPVMGSSLVTRTLGTAPARRFVVQWTSFAFFGDDRARLTLQARLYEGTNVIELHYCALTAGMGAGRVTGDSATVGIESPDGTGGREHSHNTAMSVGTTNGIRFTP